MSLSYFSLLEGQQTCLSGQMRPLRGPYPFNWDPPHQRFYSLEPQHSSTDAENEGPRVGGLFPLLHGSCAQAGSTKKGKKTIEKPEEKQTQNIASAPIDTQCYMNRKYPWEPRYSTNPISTIPFYIWIVQRKSGLHFYNYQRQPEGPSGSWCDLSKAHFAAIRHEGSFYIN